LSRDLQVRPGRLSNPAQQQSQPLELAQQNRPVPSSFTTQQTTRVTIIIGWLRSV